MLRKRKTSTQTRVSHSSRVFKIRTFFFFQFMNDRTTWELRLYSIRIFRLSMSINHKVFLVNYLNSIFWFDHIPPVAPICFSKGIGIYISISALTVCICVELWCRCVVDETSPSCLRRFRAFELDVCAVATAWPRFFNRQNYSRAKHNKKFKNKIEIAWPITQAQASFTVAFSFRSRVIFFFFLFLDVLSSVERCANCWLWEKITAAAANWWLIQRLNHIRWRRWSEFLP